MKTPIDKIKEHLDNDIEISKNIHHGLCRHPLRVPTSEVYITKQTLKTLLTRQVNVIEKLVEALEKIHRGPGNKMENWKQTWAHEYSGKALDECAEIMENGKLKFINRIPYLIDIFS